MIMQGDMLSRGMMSIDAERMVTAATSLMKDYFNFSR